jgi:hypothetical protein
VFAQALDDAISYDEPIETSILPAKNGEADGWTLGHRSCSEDRHRSRVTTGGVTGGEGATG